MAIQRNVSHSAIHANESLHYLRSAMEKPRHQRKRDTMESIVAETARLFVRNYSLPHL